MNGKNTNATAATRPAPGTVLHIKTSGTTIFGRVWLRGDELTLTPEMISGSVDRLDRSFLDDLSEVEQEKRWGAVRIGFGPFPKDEPKWTRGTAEQAVARDARRAQALSLPDPDEQAEALRAVEAEFGTEPTSRTIAMQGPR